MGYKEVAGRGTVTEESWIIFVFLVKPPAWAPEHAAAEPTTTVGAITKQRVPDSFVDILKKRRLLQKLPRVEGASSPLYSRFPDLRDLNLSIANRRNYCVDLHADVLRQHAEKGFAEVGVDFTDDGVKRIFILPQDQEPQPEEVITTMQKKGNGSGRRSKTTLVFYAEKGYAESSSFPPAPSPSSKRR